MAFPTTSILDNFDRANTGPPPSSSWTTVAGTGHVVNTNQLANSIADHSDSGWNVSTFGPDCELYYTVATKPANTKWCDLDVRVSALSSGWSGYQAELSPAAGTDVVDVYRVDAGAFTALGSALSQEFTAGDGYGFEAIGSTLTVYRKSGGTWSSVGSRTDSTYSSAGYLMIGAGDTTTFRGDDVGGGTVVAAGGANPKGPLSNPLAGPFGGPI